MTQPKTLNEMFEQQAAEFSNLIWELLNGQDTRIIRDLLCDGEGMAKNIPTLAREIVYEKIRRETILLPYFHGPIEPEQNLRLIHEIRDMTVGFERLAQLWNELRGFSESRNESTARQVEQIVRERLPFDF